MTYIAIVGTTEHGSVDPLSKIFHIRKAMERQGMSFMVHVDAPWGGYFALKAKPKRRASSEQKCGFSIELNDWSRNQLRCLGQAE
jgi:glutamate/tyrosine decarboxylase-like PLP-dependent enzyme